MLAKVKYKFCRCQTHPDFPDLQDWRIEIRPDDRDTLVAIHKGVARSYFDRERKDPHPPFYGAVNLGARWLETVEKLLCDGSVYVNMNGGVLPHDAVKILETIESNKIDWHYHADDEVITISRWPEGKHYYLSSNKQRIFVPEKYNTYQQAREAALKFVKSKNIKSNCH